MRSIPRSAACANSRGSFQNLAVRRVVVHYQNAHVLQNRWVSVGAGARRVVCRSEPSREVECDPLPDSLSTQIWPPIISTKRIEMESPSPVPPYRRVVDVSAWVNGSKMIFCFLGRMPMPVSVTVKCSVHAVRSAFRFDAQDDLALVGELDRVPGRFNTTCRKRRIADHELRQSAERNRPVPSLSGVPQRTAISWHGPRCPAG